MGHPDYVYRPISETHRARLREAHRLRLGNPAGFRRVYGVHVPETCSERIRYFAQIVSMYRGFAGAKAFVLAAKEDNYNIERSPISAWGEREWQLYRDLVAEGMSREDVARFAKVAEWYLNRGLSQHRKGRRL